MWMIWRILILITFWSSQLWAQLTYTVGVENVDFSPISSVRMPGNEYQGLSRQILDRFAKSEKIQFKYVPLPIRRFQQEYWLGNLDFAFPDNPEWNRDRKKNMKITYSGPVISFQDAVLVRPQKVGQGFDQIKSIGTVRGFTLWKFQDLIEAKKLRVVAAPSPNSLVQMLLAGHVDAINLPPQIANFHLKKIGRVGAMVPDPALMPIQKSNYYVSSIHHPEIIQKLNRFLVKDAPAIRKILKENGF